MGLRRTCECGEPATKLQVGARVCERCYELDRQRYQRKVSGHNTRDRRLIDEYSFRLPGGLNSF